MNDQPDVKKVLILTYYFPPSGGSGVQRWMYFSKYLKDFGIEPFVLTVDPEKASYKFLDKEFLEHVKDVKVYRTSTSEPLKLYSKIVGGDERAEIPQGFAGESKPGLFRIISRFIRGNFFIPDARKGWNRYALRKAEELILREKIDLVITNGTPHSTHIVGLKLQKKFGIRWICDLRDPWTEAYYNKDLYRTIFAKYIDESLEQRVLANADMVRTIGPGVAKLLRQKISAADQAKVRYVYNGYDAQLFAGLEKHPTSNFTVLHLGILSENQPILPFIMALKNVIDLVEGMKDKTILLFVGKVSPSIVAQVKEYLPEINLTQVDYVPHQEAVQYMLDANLLLNSLAETKESELLISGKLMEYVATGNPILVLGNPLGDAAQLLNEFDHAEVFARSNQMGIEKFLKQIYIDWTKGIQYKKSQLSIHSRYETARQYAGLIDELI